MCVMTKVLKYRRNTKTTENENDKDVRYKIKQEFQSKMPMIEMFDNFLESKMETIITGWKSQSNSGRPMQISMIKA